MTALAWFFIVTSCLIEGAWVLEKTEALCERVGGTPPLGYWLVSVLFSVVYLNWRRQIPPNKRVMGKFVQTKEL
jgi:hypothetical protein